MSAASIRLPGAQSPVLQKLIRERTYAAFPFAVLLLTGCVCFGAGPQQGAMIAWIVGMVTVIRLLFIFWRRSSQAFRDRAEEPGYLFFASLGIPAPRNGRRAKSKPLEENKDESTHS